MKTARLAAVLLLVPGASSLAGQAAPGAAGHWEGAIRAPGLEVMVEVDLSWTAQGQLAGTLTRPGGELTGFPLSGVTLQGSSLSFAIAGMGGGTFRGVLAGDGRSLAGEFTTADGQSMPFSLARTGEARVTTIPGSPAIGRELEGSWSGTLEVEGRSLRFILTLANHPDGSSAGSLASPDQGDVQLPVTISQEGRSVTIEVPAIGASYAATLSASGQELIGTFTQGASLPLTLRRDAP